MRSKNLFSVVTSFCLLFTSNTSFAAITLAPLFSDHMVLQRNTDITISGQATKNQIITINIAQQALTTTSDNHGNFSTTIYAEKAGGPYTLSVSTPIETTQVNDVYFGDVWLASGQSNMEWKLKWEVNNHLAEIKDSNYPLIRYFDVKNQYLATPQTTLNNSEWVLASQQTSPEFSAVAWFFAKKLHLEKNVPIAVIDSTWGGTPAEAWTPLEALVKLNGYQESAQALIDEPALWDAIFDQTRLDEIEKSRKLTTTQGHSKLKLSSINYDDSSWNKVDLPLPELLSDIVWARKIINLTADDITEKGLEIKLGSYPQFSQVYVNEQHILTKLGEDKESSYFVAKDVLKVGKNLLAIRALNAWNNKNQIGRKGQINAVTMARTFDISQGWRINNSVEGKLPMPERYWQKTAVLYNAMIHPIIHYPIKGAIWYQGESNISRSAEYHELFTAMIKSWRSLWQQQDMPFIFAQLASMKKTTHQPVESEWALLREAQTQSLALDNTAMAVLLDAGEQWDIHPRNKQIVGERMWHAANAIAYGENNVYAGPTASSHKHFGNKLVIKFKNIGSGFQAKDKLIGFEVAGKDGIYMNAKAKISGDDIIIWSKNVTNPKSIRYGWADNSPANLYNQEGFPAVPFRLGE